jgi:hypothetical protein
VEFDILLGQYPAMDPPASTALPSRVYDFFVSHEAAGMVGRIIVGKPGQARHNHSAMRPKK